MLLIFEIPRKADNFLRVAKNSLRDFKSLNFTPIFTNAVGYHYFSASLKNKYCILMKLKL